MTCPDCGNTLAEEAFSGIQVDGCAACGGLFLDSGELKELIADPVSLEAAERENVPQAERGESVNSDRRCPKCGGGFMSYHYAYSTPVVLDLCASCSGLWVQDGELAKIEEYFRGFGKPISNREQDALEVAKYSIEHDKMLDRARRFSSLANLLRRRPPFWRE